MDCYVVLKCPHALVPYAVELIRELWMGSKNIATTPVKLVQFPSRIIANTFIFAQWITDGFEVVGEEIVNPRIIALSKFLEQENVIGIYRWPNCPLPPQLRKEKDKL